MVAGDRRRRTETQRGAGGGSEASGKELMTQDRLWWGLLSDLCLTPLQLPVAVSTRAPTASSSPRIIPRTTPADKSACTSSSCPRTMVSALDGF